MLGRPVMLLLVLFVRLAASEGTTILNKCCPLGQQWLVTGSSANGCGPSAAEFDIPPIYSAPDVRSLRPVSLVYKPLVCTNVAALFPEAIEEERHTILDSGQLLFQNGKVEDVFCLETINDRPKPSIFVCIEEQLKNYEKPVDFIFLPIGSGLSLVCLIALLVVYSMLQELRNDPGKLMMNHAAALAFGYLVLFYSHICASDIWGDNLCFFLGYAIQFFFMATFFWLNVMCFDIYWAFSGLRNLTGSVKERERKKLILYSIYAWCTPLLILIITVAVDLSPSVPANSIFKPQVGVDKCFFREQTATWIYFYLPMALIILSNIFLFTVTAYRIWSHRKEAAVLKRGDSRKHDSTNDKERFSLYLKLFIVMGINWVMELLSSIVGGPSYLWYIPDFTNTLQGVFIFIIFVWKKRVRRLVRAKIYACLGKKMIPSDTSNGSTRNTNSSDASRTNNSIKMTPTTQSFETTVP